MSAVCTTLLVVPAIWQPRLAQACGELEYATADMAGAILRCMHDRHLGMTPELAADLAILVSEPRAHARQESPWSRIFERLTAELRPHRSAWMPWRSGGRQRVGMLLAASPLYSVLGIAQPIVGLAIQQLGRNLLFCEDAQGSASVDDESYADYAAALAETFENLAKSEDPKMVNFWRGLALVLAGLSREALPGKSTHRHLPRIDATTLALLEHARPAVLMPLPPKHQPRRQPATRTLSRLHKLKEGGVDGIRISRRPEDVSSMLFSEYVRPRPLLADRLLNSGFLVLRREPRYEALRDVMIVALVPGELNNPIHLPMLKLAFYELSLRLGFMLCRHRLNKTVFRWVEGHRLAGLRDMAFNLDALPQSDRPLMGHQPDNYFRHRFLTTLGWLPRFVDRQAPYQRDHRGAIAALREASDGPAVWLRRAWRGLPQAEIEPPAMAASRFSFVHVLVLAPEGFRYKERYLNLVNARALLGLGPRARVSMSLTVIPRDVKDVTGWRLQTSDGDESKTMMLDAEAGDISAMAGRLTSVWLTILLREIWRG